MFQKIKSFLSSAWNRCFTRKKDEGQYDLYKPNYRLIYRYWDGEKVVSIDPMVLFKKLLPSIPKLVADRKLAFSSGVIEGAVDAHARLMKQLRDWFGIKVLEENGLTETEVLDLFDHFCFYCKLTGISVEVEVPKAKPKEEVNTNDTTIPEIPKETPEAEVKKTTDIHSDA